MSATYFEDLKNSLRSFAADVIVCEIVLLKLSANVFVKTRAKETNIIQAD